MTNEIVRRDAPTPTDTLRTLMTLDGDDALSIAKTALKDGSKGLIARGLSVLQRWNEDRFCGALLSEIEEMRSAGKIREDFNRTDAGVSSLREFFELIDGKPDEERFHAFCALFMSANAPDANSNEAILDLELMSILRSLGAAEMHLLSAFLKVRRYHVSGTSLMNLLSKELGFKSDALVFKNVTALIENNLGEKGNWTNQGGTPGQEKSLLTDLGVALLERIIRFDAFKEAQK
jgi:hypothetical protein